MFTDLLGYITSLKTRIKMYKVWAAPAIEFFMLQEIMSNTKASILEPLQHKFLTKTLRLGRTSVSKIETNTMLHELNIYEKTQRFAHTLTQFPVVSELIESDKITKLDYTHQKSTRQGIVYINDIYKFSNTLTLKIDVNAVAWGKHLDRTKDTQKVKLDYENLQIKLSNIRKRTKLRFTKPD